MLYTDRKRDERDDEMTTASIVEDVIKAVDENPPALEALRSRLLTRELLATPARVADLADSHANLADSHAKLADSHARFVETTQEFMAATREFMATTREFMVATNERFDRLESFVRSIHHDVGVLKGHYARGSAEAYAFGIADEHGFDFKRALARSEILAMIRAADTSDISRDVLRSFSAADFVMLVEGADGEDRYIAVEISYTVHWNDVERAIRNAELIARFTGRPAHPLVAGVDVNERVMKFAIETGKALWSRLPDRMVQAD